MSETNRAYLTKEAIRQALLRQIERKDISRVKVADLVSDAHVSKATFYRYYKDTYDLLADCFTVYLEVKDEIDKATSHGDLVVQQRRLTLLGTEKIRDYPRLFSCAINAPMIPSPQILPRDRFCAPSMPQLIT